MITDHDADCDEEDESDEEDEGDEEVDNYDDVNELTDFFCGCRCRNLHFWGNANR